MTGNLWKASLSITLQTELYQLRFELIQFLLVAYNQLWQSSLSEDRCGILLNWFYLKNKYLFDTLHYTPKFKFHPFCILKVQ